MQVNGWNPRHLMNVNTGGWNMVCHCHFVTWFVSINLCQSTRVVLATSRMLNHLCPTFNPHVIDSWSRPKKQMAWRALIRSFNEEQKSDFVIFVQMEWLKLLRDHKNRIVNEC